MEEQDLENVSNVTTGGEKQSSKPPRVSRRKVLKDVGNIAEFEERAKVGDTKKLENPAIKWRGLEDISLEEIFPQKKLLDGDSPALNEGPDDVSAKGTVLQKKFSNSERPTSEEAGHVNRQPVHNRVSFDSYMNDRNRSEEVTWPYNRRVGHQGPRCATGGVIPRVVNSDDLKYKLKGHDSPNWIRCYEDEFDLPPGTLSSCFLFSVATFIFLCYVILYYF